MHFLMGNWYLCFCLLVTSALGFKARLDIACILSYLHTIPHIYLWCDTCQYYDSQNGGLSHSVHVFFSTGRMLGFEWMISHSAHRRAINPATAPGLGLKALEIKPKSRKLKIEWNAIDGRIIKPSPTRSPGVVPIWTDPNPRSAVSRDETRIGSCKAEINH